MWDLIVSVPDHCLSFYFAGNKDRHKHDKSSNEFEFGPDRIIHFGVYRPCVLTVFPIDL